MRRITLIMFFLLSILPLAQANECFLQNNARWKSIEQNMHDNKYEETLQDYKLLLHELDSVYKDINSRQVEDLRRTYSIDELAIESSKEKSKLLFMLLVVLVPVVFILTLFYLYQNYQKNKLVKSQMKLEEATHIAEESIRNKSLFLSNMSHEIRTPLNALSGFSAVLTEKGIDEATRQQCNEVIQQNSKLLLKLINDVVDISCIDISQMKFNIKDCNAVNLCQNVVNTLIGVKQTAADILFDCPLPALTIETDTVRLQQVLINLLVNATKFTKEGTITLSLNVNSKGMAEFSISDTGPGIPTTQQERIFDRFEKLNEKAQGSGIGLSICRDIINQLGGQIWIDASYTNGARFVFTHPLKQSK